MPDTPANGSTAASTAHGSHGNADLPADLVQLAAAIRELPADYAEPLLPLLEHVVESTGRRRRILSLVQDALGQLRLDMKYLMFDLEATRRERDDAQQRVEDLADEAGDDPIGDGGGVDFE
ncbi:MAG: transcriptional regulator [Planctomycetota bacterium]